MSATQESAGVRSSGIKPEPRVTVRLMRGTDIEGVSRIERYSFPTVWSTQAYVTELANPSAAYFVATVGERDKGTERVIGYIGLWVVMDEAHVTTIAVAPDCRGHGVAARLLAELLAASVPRGATRATLEVRSGNVPAHRLYERFGFVKVAVRRGYYADNNEDADIMWINDMTTPEWLRSFAENRAALGLEPVTLKFRVWDE